MRLTQFSDYALRVLMYAAEHPERLVTITELADFHRISRSHLTKVVVHLAGSGYLQSVRGRGGGLRLAREAASIRIGEVLRGTEEDFRLVECFDRRTDACVLTPHCRLACGLHAALDAFFQSLDGLTLADLTAGGGARIDTQTVALPTPTGRARRTVPAA
ncbi:RrF2 family transcriptional regulator [Thiomonas sp.]|uniref:HTH-type transcriptional regulator nsrR n=1 Tax=mine drainage metagenome TaxID=410659 RepID=E6PRU0_9ZZZZ